MTGRPYPPAAERFWAKVEKQPNGCWIWRGALLPSGYGQFMPDGRRSGPRRVVRAHVFSWLILHSRPLPTGHELHHLIEEGICSSTSCVNPEHLVAVTRREHAHRTSRGFAALNIAKKKCPRGHRLSGENLIVDNGRRRCRVCRRAQRKAYYGRSGR